MLILIRIVINAEIALQQLFVLFGQLLPVNKCSTNRLIVSLQVLLACNLCSSVQCWNYVGAGNRAVTMQCWDHAVLVECSTPYSAGTMLYW